MPNTARATSLRPDPTSPARATISPARTSSEMSVNTPSRVRCSTRSTSSPATPRSPAARASICRPTMARTRSSAVSPASSLVRTCRPSRMTVTRWQISKTSSSRWEMNRTAAPPERSVRDHVEQPGHLGGGQRRGGLVHHDHPGVQRQRLGDLDDLLVRDGQPAADAARVELDPQPGEQGGGVRVHPAPVDAPPGQQRLAPHEDVLGHAQVGEERGLLVDDRDPGVLGTGRAVQADRRPVDQQLTGIRLVHPGQDLHHRGLAGAVLAQQRVRLAGVQVDRAVGDRAHGAERFRRAVQGQDGAAAGAAVAAVRPRALGCAGEAGAQATGGPGLRCPAAPGLGCAGGAGAGDGGAS